MIATTMQRQRDWRTRLLAWSQEMVGLQFEWGATDCASLARAALKEMFGEDLLPKETGAWDSPRAAANAIFASGGPDVVLQSLGAEQVGLPFVRSGDIIVAAEVAEPISGLMIVVCIDGKLGLGCSSADGVQFVDCTTLPADSRAYSLWEVQRG